MAVLDKFKKKKIQGVDDTEYLTLRDERRISKENAKITREFERNKARKNVPESEYLSQMRDSRNVVEFDDLHTYFYTDIGTVKAVDGVTYDVPQGTTVGIVGESGCGKSVTSMTSLNPVFTIGEQMDEVVLLHEEGATAESAKAHSIEMLQLVGIAMPDKVYASYPHELSGGMRQRVMIAMALSCGPRLIIADEPTTALDVTIQAQILDLLRGIKDKINGSIMLITHDLGVIAEMADYVVVMYAGRIIEKGTVREIFHTPKHPYTVGLMRSKPSVNKAVDRLYSIPGQVPNPINMPNHCYFKNRCEKCTEKCGGEYPPMLQFSPTHFAACYLYEEDRDAVYFDALTGKKSE